MSDFQEWWEWHQFHDSTDVACPWRSAWWEWWCGFNYTSDFRWMWRKHSVRMASHSLLEQLTCCCLQNVHWNATWKIWSLRLLISLARKTSSLQRWVVHKIQFCLREGREHDILKLLQFSQNGRFFFFCTLRMVQRTDQDATRITVRLSKWSICEQVIGGKDVSCICWNCTMANCLWSGDSQVVYVSTT